MNIICWFAVHSNNNSTVVHSLNKIQTADFHIIYPVSRNSCLLRSKSWYIKQATFYSEAWCPFFCKGGSKKDERTSQWGFPSLPTQGLSTMCSRGAVEHLQVLQAETFWSPFWPFGKELMACIASFSAIKRARTKPVDWTCASPLSFWTSYA